MLLCSSINFNWGIESPKCLHVNRWHNRKVSHRVQSSMEKKVKLMCCNIEAGSRNSSCSRFHHVWHANRTIDKNQIFLWHVSRTSEQNYMAGIHQINLISWYCAPTLCIGEGLRSSSTVTPYKCADKCSFGQRVRNKKFLVSLKCSRNKNILLVESRCFGKRFDSSCFAKLKTIGSKNRVSTLFRRNFQFKHQNSCIVVRNSCSAGIFVDWLLETVCSTLCRDFAACWKWILCWTAGRAHSFFF